MILPRRIWRVVPGTAGRYPGGGCGGPILGPGALPRMPGGHRGGNSPGGPRTPKGALMPGGGGPRKPNGGGPGILMKGRHLMRGKNLGPGGLNPPRYPPLPRGICNREGDTKPV